MNTRQKTRERSNSVTTIEDFFKRKGINREESEVKETEEVFKKSKKVIRTPTKKQQYPVNQLTQQSEKNSMEELKILITNMSKEIREEIKNNKEELKNEIIKNIEAIDVLKNEIMKKQEEWNQEKQILEDRIVKLERKIEADEKRKRVKTIVIKGLNTDVRDQEKQVKDFFERNLQQTVCMKEVYIIGKKDTRPAVVVELNTREEKIRIMQNKYKLRGKEIFIDDYMTVEERKIQTEIRRKAKEERNNGRQVKKKFKKHII